MAIKPILFNSDMVRAILDGRKTVTRRVVKPQPTKNNKPFISDTLGFKTLWYGNDYYKFPYQMGDILYVRETWADRGDGSYMYKADYRENEKFYRGGKEVAVKWKPSIHMPKEAARIFLRVTNVSVAKLQDITEEQAKAEGAEANNVLDAVHEFRIIWDDTLKGEKALIEYGWFANPWAWVIEFERTEKPEDF